MKKRILFYSCASVLIAHLAFADYMIGESETWGWGWALCFSMTAPIAWMAPWLMGRYLSS